MAKRLLFTPDGSVPVFADPVVAQLGGLTQEQIQAGCAFNMFPPFRPECHVTGKEHAVIIPALPELDPDFDVECESKGRRIPHCYVTIGGHVPHIGQTDSLEDPQQPSEDPSTTLLPAPFPSDDPENWTSPDVPPTEETSHDVPWPKETRTVETATVVSSHPVFSVPFTSSPYLITPSSGPSPYSTPRTSSLTPVPTSHSSATTTDWSSSSHIPGSTSSEAHYMVSSSHSSAVATSLPVVTSSPIVNSSPSTTISPSATHSFSLFHIPGPTSSAAQPTDSPSRSSTDTTSSPIVTSPSSTITSPGTTHSGTMVPSGITSLPSTTSSSDVRSTHSSSVTRSSGTISSSGSTSLGLKDSSSSRTNKASETGTASSSKSSTAAPETSITSPSNPSSAEPETRITSPSKPSLAEPETSPALSLTPNTDSKTSPGASSKTSLTDANGLPTEELDPHLTAVVDALGPDDKHKKHLALGLSIGLGAGIPSAGLVRWLGTFFHTLSTVAKSSKVYTSVMRALTTFKMDMIPHFNFSPPGRPGAPGRPGGGTPESEVAESVDEWYDDLCRNGNTGEQAAEIINNFKADMAAAEAAMANEPVGVESAVNAAAGRSFANPSALNSWGVQAAAQVASTPGSSIGEIADSLLKAGVPAEAVSSTAEAVSHSVNTAGKGWIGRPAYNAALGVISSSVTSAGMAGAEAAKAAVKGATGPGLAASLGAAGVPASAADATAAAVTEAIQAAAASGSDPVIDAINVISNAASPSGLAAGAAWDGASGSSLAPALSAAGVPTDALGATAAAVGAAMSANSGSRSDAINAASEIIASAASPPYERMSNPAPPVSPAQAAFDVVGATFNFWHIIPWLAWDTLNKMEVNETDSSDMDSLANLLAIGPPPEEWSSRFTSFPYRRGGDRVTGVPSLPTDAVRPTPSSTNQGMHNGAHNGTQSLTPTLEPAPPGTGGYLYDGTKPVPSAQG
ncbi:hypothetical protein INS49_015484 [Diaporthe citri]|uniref:uncharacterized protein n=1 Tax=Diaporthe citri TaxID=83186 RepID=UPI001C826C48|nr:uncharacterized protein INS49_015484 [Diaporthe citri]KAG6356099.1 hypothetical protein INS49_015484 [Diaporthe citri]